MTYCKYSPSEYDTGKHPQSSHRSSNTRAMVSPFTKNSISFFSVVFVQLISSFNPVFLIIISILVLLSVLLLLA
jgi:hypothetical protein